MSQQLRHFDITLTLAAPFNTASAEPARLGIDAPLLRDHQGRICLPGTLVHGRVVEEIGNWQSFPKLNARLGGKATDDRWKPDRKALVFVDFTVDNATAPPTASFVRISKDRDSGTVKRHHLQIIEQAGEPGGELTFTGYASVVCDTSEAESIAKELRGALGLVPNFGADRSVGYGRVLNVDVKLRAAATSALTWPNNATRVELVLQLDRPFLVTEGMTTENLFVGSDTIAGNALKGAFADTCKALNLPFPWAGFDDVVFSHAFCSGDSARARAVPDSVVEFKLNGHKLALDLAHHADALVLGIGEDTSAPLFNMDWKSDPMPPGLATYPGKHDGTLLHKKFGWAKPSHTLRVRTAIDAETRAAADTLLFAYDRVVHEHDVGTDDNPKWQRLTWRSVIDISAVPSIDQPAAGQHLIQLLQHGLVGLGKTKANVTVVSITKSTATPTTVGAGQTIFLTLQTPALLTAPGALREGSTAADLHDAYRETFDELSGHSLGLSHFYARQNLRGGKYQHTRFKGAPQQYTPWLITEAGAVFALKVIDVGKASAALKRWTQQGLAIPTSWGAECAKWQHNPYLPQNGFGEIGVNYPEHESWSPSKFQVNVSPAMPAA